MTNKKHGGLMAGALATLLVGCGPDQASRVPTRGIDQAITRPAAAGRGQVKTLLNLPVSAGMSTKATVDELAEIVIELIRNGSSLESKRVTPPFPQPLTVTFGDQPVADGFTVCTRGTDARGRQLVKGGVYCSEPFSVIEGVVDVFLDVHLVDDSGPVGHPRAVVNFHNGTSYTPPPPSQPTGTVVATIPADEPRALAVGADGVVWSASAAGSVLGLGAGTTVQGPYFVEGMHLGIAVDGEGSLWVTNSNTDVVTKLSQDGNVLGQFQVGTGPYSVAVDVQGNIWTANRNAGTVSRLSTDGTVQATVAVGTLPAGLVIDSTGVVWVGGNLLSRVSPDGTLLSSEKVYHQGVAIDTASSGLAVDARGDVWISNPSGSSVTRFSALDGSVMGSYRVGPNPVGVAVDRSGNIWVANEGDHSVTRLAPDGTTLNTFPACSKPQGVAVDLVGNIWIACTGSNTVIKMLP